MDSARDVVDRSSLSVGGDAGVAIAVSFLRLLASNASA
jgi:hypothetical protein